VLLNIKRTIMSKANL